MAEINEQALENKCPSCNASISFDPKTSKWKCDYCGGSFTLEEMQKHNNASSKKNNEYQEKSIEESDDNYVSYKCKSCGAEIIADEQTAATFCVYCGNTAILKSKLVGKFTPDLIIPFQKTKDDAITAFKGLSKGRPLMPKLFNNPNNIEKIKGVYIPFWLYNVSVSGGVDCKATRIKKWSSGNTHYTKTSIYKTTRKGSMNFLRVPVDGSSKFDNDIMNTIEPFNYNELQKYNHAFLSGFYAEKYDVDFEKAYSDASSRSLESAKEIMKNDGPFYDTKQITSNTLAPSLLNKEYVLLPVWMVNVKYGDKQHTFAMNAQTGEFVGNIPLDTTKVILFSLIIFIVTFLLVFLVSYLTYIN